ncbi:hypothetical protein D3C87_358800 [compost metagenome]|uniref:hypothetical protein n=1 Tax=Variovorax boronicumulans TaxID=436515 RepID=UPI000FBC02F4|nr:hypothetical protein [Variovorax boronicumulans]
MRHDFWLVAVAMLSALLATHTTHLAAADDSVPSCLYGTFTQGDEKTPIEPCGADIKGIGADPSVLAAMRTFNIPTNVVVFQACPGGRFSAMPDSTDSTRFLVRYPSTAKANFLAPIVHELAHVVQMRSAGGLAALRSKESSRRIELAADFLAGLAFNISLKSLNGADFETNLQLAGSYKVEADDHGLPEHRTQAFRRGQVRAYPYPQLTILESLAYWNANDYARISR